MSNGSGAPVGGWTLDTLKIVVDGEIAALRGVTDARSVAADARASEAKEAVTVGLAAAQTALAQAAILAKDAVTEAKLAHAAEHAALAMALALAMLELKEKLVEMNSMRQQINVERSDMVTRDRLQASVKVLEDQLVAAVTTIQGAASALFVTFDARLNVMESAHASRYADGVMALARADTAQMDRVTKLEREHNDRLAALERNWANLQGRFWALGVGLTVFVVILQFVMGFLSKGLAP